MPDDEPYTEADVIEAVEHHMKQAGKAVDYFIETHGLTPAGLHPARAFKAMVETLVMSAQEATENHPDKSRFMLGAIAATAIVRLAKDNPRQNRN